MEVLFQQIGVALASDLYYLSLSVSLTLPHICGAMSSADGWGGKSAYIQWFDQYVGHRFGPMFTGEDCYYFRCSLLHQGSTQHESSRYRRIFFREPVMDDPDDDLFHMNIIEGALNIDVRVFCAEILSGGLRWHEQAQTTPEYQRNYPRFAQRYPHGLAPYGVGRPIIG